jgi:hypothetical protein
MSWKVIKGFRRRYWLGLPPTLFYGQATELQIPQILPDAKPAVASGLRQVGENATGFYGGRWELYKIRSEICNNPGL